MIDNEKMIMMLSKMTTQKRRVYQGIVVGIALFVFWTRLPGTCLANPKLSATRIIEISERTLQGDTQVGIYKITINTRRWTREMEMKYFMNRVEKKTFSEIYAPKKDAGNRFLLLDKRMWHYIPKLQQTVKISPSMMMQSWMGSDFTNDDIVKESSILTDYTHTLMGTVKTGSFECYQIQLDPKPDAAVVWGKIVYFARIEDCLPVREEFYNEHQVLKKILTFDRYQRMHDRIIPTLFKMQTIKKKDRYTLLEIKQAKFNIPIPDTIFSFQYLKRK